MTISTRSLRHDIPSVKCLVPALGSPSPETLTTLPDTIQQDQECPDCLTRSGLCRSCQRTILPQLRVNRGWLKLMGEAHAEQTRRQDARANVVAVQKAERREQRKRLRSLLRNGRSGLLLTLAVA